MVVQFSIGFVTGNNMETDFVADPFVLSSSSIATLMRARQLRFRIRDRLSNPLQKLPYRQPERSGRIGAKISDAKKIIVRVARSNVMSLAARRAGKYLNELAVRPA